MEVIQLQLLALWKYNKYIFITLFQTVLKKYFYWYSYFKLNNIFFLDYYPTKYLRNIK